MEILFPCILLFLFLGCEELFHQVGLIIMDPLRLEASFYKGAMCCVMWRLASPYRVAIEI